MKNIKLGYRYLIIAASITFILYACTEFKEPPLINNPDVNYSPSPVISEIIPADSAMAGIREITIKGQDFAVNGSDTNWVL